MSEAEMIGAFAQIIQSSLEQYVRQEHPLIELSQWLWKAFAVVALLVIAGFFFHRDADKAFKGAHVLLVLIAVTVLFQTFAKGALHTTNMGVYYGLSLEKIAYPSASNPNSFLGRGNLENPICCSITRHDYKTAKDMGFETYSRRKAAALVELVLIEQKAKQADAK